MNSSETETLRKPAWLLGFVTGRRRRRRADQFASRRSWSILGCSTKKWPGTGLFPLPNVSCSGHGWARSNQVSKAARQMRTVSCWVPAHRRQQAARGAHPWERGAKQLNGLPDNYESSARPTSPRRRVPRLDELERRTTRPRKNRHASRSRSITGSRAAGGAGGSSPGRRRRADRIRHRLGPVTPLERRCDHTAVGAVAGALFIALAASLFYLGVRPRRDRHADAMRPSVRRQARSTCRLAHRRDNRLSEAGHCPASQPAWIHVQP